MIRWRKKTIRKKRTLEKKICKERLIHWRKDDTFEKKPHRREKDAPREKLSIVGRKTRQIKSDMPGK